ncbi:hypothetical protein HDE_09551 [Halotydeus destructor]|nr:hypothetical protein HDE_09551 [Halotydeus destructor]
MVKNITEEGEAITEIAEDTAEEMIRLEFCKALAEDGIAACSNVRDESAEVTSESRNVPSVQKVTSSESEKPATPTERVDEEDKEDPSQESGKSPETGVVDSNASTVPGPVDEQEVGPPIQRMERKGLPETPVVDLEEDEEATPSGDVTLTNEPVAQSPEMSPIVEPSPDEVTLTSRQSALIPDEPPIRDISSPERK